MALRKAGCGFWQMSCKVSIKVWFPEQAAAMVSEQWIGVSKEGYHMDKFDWKHFLLLNIFITCTMFRDLDWFSELNFYEGML